jgi:hypothetical protein
MNRRMIAGRLSVVLVPGLFALCSCSSDAPAEPEPRFDQPGAFVAMDEGAPSLLLFRTLSPWITEAQSFLFVTVYDVEPKNWDEAREISKSHDIPLRKPLELLTREGVEVAPHRVVWFRTLTVEEEDRIP